MSNRHPSPSFVHILILMLCLFFFSNMCLALSGSCRPIAPTSVGETVLVHFVTECTSLSVLKINVFSVTHVVACAAIHYSCTRYVTTLLIFSCALMLY